MNFEFSDDDCEIQAQARALLADRIPMPRHAHESAETPDFNRPLWKEIAELGWLSCAVPEAEGGIGLGYDALALLLEEVGASLAPIPFSSAVMAIELVQRFAEPELKASLLPGLMSGETVGCVYAPTGGADGQNAANFRDGRLTAEGLIVLNGLHADTAIVLAHDAERGESAWVVVDLSEAGVKREVESHIEPWRGHARLSLTDAPARRLREGNSPADAAEGLDRLAILLAWEQIGAARACLDAGCDYARERIAFGRQIGSFQAVKHRLVDVYADIEIARSHAYVGLCALADDELDIAAPAASARLAAGKAQQRAARDNFITHGGMGFTWEADCHRYIRRDLALRSALAGPDYWRRRLVKQLVKQTRVEA